MGRRQSVAASSAPLSPPSSFPPAAVPDLIPSNRRSRKYQDLLSKKRTFLNELLKSKATVQEQESQSTEWKDSQLTAIDFKIRQLDTLELMLNTSLNVMRQLLSETSQPNLNADHAVSSEYFDDMKRQNLEIMSQIQTAALQAQQDYKQTANKAEEVAKAEELAKKDTPERNTIAEEIVDGVFDSIGDAVEQLEGRINQENNFQDAQKTGTLQTVVKVDDETPRALSNDTQETGKLSSGKDGTSEDTPAKSKSSAASTLIDTDNNRYVLMRSNDPTEHIEDIKLFHDVVYIISLSFAVSVLFDVCGLPAFFGNIVAGVLLGPTGWNQLQVSFMQHGPFTSLLLEHHSSGDDRAVWYLVHSF